jgi:hypothetical protein
MSITHCTPDPRELDFEHEFLLELLQIYGSSVTNSDLVEYAALCGVFLTWDQVRDLRHDLFFLQTGGR